MRCVLTLVIDRRTLAQLAHEANVVAIDQGPLFGQLHNAGSTIGDLEAEGTSVLGPFNVDRNDQLWWHT